MEINGNEIRGCEVKYLPIISAYASRIGLVEAVDGLLDCDMEVSPGRMVLAMILDGLSGRSPLFRMEEFFVDQDVELLFGRRHPVDKDAGPHVWTGFGQACPSRDQQGSRRGDDGSDEEL